MSGSSGKGLCLSAKNIRCTADRECHFSRLACPLKRYIIFKGGSESRRPASFFNNLQEIDASIWVSTTYRRYVYGRIPNFLIFTSYPEGIKESRHQLLGHL
jgi:hypothetical protein